MEAHGQSDFIKVGEIEQQINWPLRVEEKYGSVEDQEYFTRRMRIQFDEFMICMQALERDIEINDEIKESMVEFVSGVIGHKAWAYVVRSRYLRIQQIKQ